MEKFQEENDKFEEVDNGSSINKSWKQFQTLYERAKEGFLIQVGRTRNRITAIWIQFRKRW